MRSAAKILLLIATLCITAGAAWAAPENDSGTGWTYTSNDKTLVITGNNTTSCTSWRNSAKFSPADVETVDLSSYTADIIPANAFSECSLTSVTIPSNIVTIATRAFADCSRLSAVDIKSGSKLETIGNFAFKGCSKLEGITLPSTLTSIEDSAFNSSGLTSITIPANVTTLGMNVFNGCKSLTGVSFASGSKLVSIPVSAFYDCSQLNGVTIPLSVETIEASAFANCAGLKNISFEPNSKLTSIGATAFQNTPIENITIPSGVKDIGTKALDVDDTEKLTVTFSGAEPPVLGGNAIPSDSTIKVPTGSDPDKWGSALAGGGVTSGIIIGSDSTPSYAIKIDNVGTGAGFDGGASLGKWMKVGDTATINAGTRSNGDKFRYWSLPNCIEFSSVSVSTDVSAMIRLIDSADAIITAVWETVTPDYPVKVVSSPANACTVLINNNVRDSLASTDVKVGDAVSVDITPNAGFTFSHWTADGIDVSAVSTDRSIAFKQPAGGVVLTAHFSGAGSYILTLNYVGTDASIEHGGNTHTGTASISSNVAYSDDVTVNAGTRSMSGISYSFKEWHVASEAEITFSPDADASSRIAQFKMPSANVSLTASWRQNKLYNSSITDPAGSDRTWRNGDGDLLIHINTELSKFDHLITVDDYPLIETVDYTVASGTVIAIDSGYLSSSALSAGSHLIRVMFNDGTADINLTKNTKSSGGGGCSAGFGGLAALALGGLVMIFRRKQA